jgi:phosphomannomutase
MIFDQSIFRAYDMRGVYPAQMNEQVAYAAGQAFVHIMQAKCVVVGRDVRNTGASIQQSLIQGIIDAGANVIEVGVISTEMLYFAAATLQCDGGITVTASHNPAQWNGMKFIGKNAEPLTKEGALGQIYAFMQENHKILEFTKGTVTTQNILPSYTEYLSRFIPESVRNTPLSIVANVNFGANGKVIDATTASLPNLTINHLNWQEDGSFPKGTPDPLLPANQRELSAAIISEKAHFGVAWDADADRCFFFDEQGRFFHGYYITSLLIDYFGTNHPSSSFVCERRLTWANQAAADSVTGTIVMSRTGHGYIKHAMRVNDAIFGGESSGHYYYKDFWFCDNGMITFLTVMGIFAEYIAQGGTISALLDRYYSQFPMLPAEQNYITDHAAEIIATARAQYGDAQINDEDGVSIEYPTWRVNIRTSSNEPVMRVNMEARTPETLQEKQAEIAVLLNRFQAVLRNDE